MTGRLSKLLSHIKGRAAYKFFLMLCMPILLVSIFGQTTNSYYINNYKSLLISIYTNEMNQFLRSTEDDVTELIGNTSMLLTNPEIQYLLNTSEDSNTLDTAKTLSVRSVLQNFNMSLSSLDNIAIINRAGSFVVTTTGVFSTESYFNSIYCYADYPYSFWQEYQGTQNSSKILAPSYVQPAGGSAPKAVTPIVFNATGSTMILYNLSANDIYSSFSRHKFTENSQMYMYNNETGEYIIGNADTTPYPGEEFLENLSSSTSIYYQIGDTDLNGEKYLALSSQKRSSILGYSYIVAIPYSDIQNHTQPLWTHIMLALGLIIFVLLIYAFIGSKFFYSPWKRLAKRLSPDAADLNGSKNILAYVNDTVSSVLEKNADLTHHLAISLPLSQEKYLVDILNNTSTGSNEEMNRLIFQHEYFVSIAINLSVDLAFDGPLPQIDAHLYREVYRAIQSMFAADFTTFSLPCVDNTLYLLLNVENDSCETKIQNKIEEVRLLMAADADYTNLFFGLGHIYHGIDGLKATHQEAISDLYAAMHDGKVHLWNTISPENSSDINDKNILTNYLLAGYGQRAAEFIQDMFNSCTNDSFDSRQQIYINLLSALYKVAKMKNKNFEEAYGKNELDFLNRVLNQPEETVQAQIIAFTRDITSDSDTSSQRKLNINVVIDYINEHYTEDIYLASLAQKFGVSTKYLSKKINQHLGISFKAYLTQLRISKAEELLTGKDIKINDVYKLVGFYNRTTFIRAFKQKIGITPSEYRNIHSYHRHEDKEN